MSVVSDYLVSIPTRDLNSVGILTINKIGEYLKNEIVELSTPNGPMFALYGGSKTSYIGAIKDYVKTWADTLSSQEIETTSDDGTVTLSYTRNDKEAINNALDDPMSGLYKLILTIETTFTTTQIAAAAQYNVPIAPGFPVLVGPSPPYVSTGQFFASITGIFTLPAAVDLATAVDTFAQTQYTSLGTG